MILRSLQDRLELDDKIKQFIREESERLILNKREVFSKEGYKNKKIYFVEDGLIRSFYYNEKGREITTNFCMKGASFACIDTLFKNIPTKYNFETLEDSIVLVCDYQKIEDLCMESVEYARLARFILGDLMTQMADRIAFLQYLSAKEKYDKLMTDTPTIIQKVPLGMVASYLGITQETLSRIRNNV